MNQNRHKWKWSDYSKTKGICEKCGATIHQVSDLHMKIKGRQLSFRKSYIKIYTGTDGKERGCFPMPECQGRKKPDCIDVQFDEATETYK